MDVPDGVQVAGGRLKRLQTAAATRATTEALAKLQKQAQYEAVRAEARGVRLDVLLDVVAEAAGAGLAREGPGCGGPATAVVLCCGDGAGVMEGVAEFAARHVKGEAVAPKPAGTRGEEKAKDGGEETANGATAGEDAAEPPAKRRRAEPDSAEEDAAAGATCAPRPAEEKQEAVTDGVAEAEEKDGKEKEGTAAAPAEKDPEGSGAAAAGPTCAPRPPAPAEEVPRVEDTVTAAAKEDGAAAGAAAAKRPRAEVEDGAADAEPMGAPVAVVVLGVEASAAAIEKARVVAAAGAADTRMGFVHAPLGGAAAADGVREEYDAAVGPWQGGADLVVAVDALETHPLEDAFRTAAAVLRPGGHFAAIAWGKGAYEGIFDAAAAVAATMGVRWDSEWVAAAYPSLATVKSVKALCEAHGFAPRKVLRWAGGQVVPPPVRPWLAAVLAPCLAVRFAEDAAWQARFVDAVAEEMKRRGTLVADGWDLGQRTVAWVVRKGTVQDP
eukprot:TRINITY_DN18520_c0_g1_i1.p1 TRINITY_DN18520_c0_g1~~TRINITY_DN18520_c0_g1_i1.p1  ORF type:complete len:498 (+),score=179.97 TRINITY_DN18520_c0_g1_i1:1439-2932(+)